MSKLRVRQHVNPLSQKFRLPVTPPDWHLIYGNLNQPLHLDIGCGWGRFLLQFAEVEPQWNFLGLEIREVLVEKANELRDEHRLNNLHYIFCNANSSLKPLLESLPEGTLKRVSIQFPDPWFKKRHHKRRVVQPELVEEIATYLPSKGEVFIQSDVLEVATEIVESFSSHAAFVRLENEWLAENPLPIPTERECSTLNRGEPVYRALFERI